MPELPEVETVRRGLVPWVVQRTVASVTVRHDRLRWPIPTAVLDRMLPGETIRGIDRRGKYLLISIGIGHLIIHLGMSGVLRYLEAFQPPAKHDHFDLSLQGGGVLRFHDPRRFGAILWTEEDPAAHRLMAPLGPEPLSDDFNVDYVRRRTRDRRVAIKNWLMDARAVVGVGNIYAAESLFLAGIHPRHPAGSVDEKGCRLLVHAVKTVLNQAIDQGGTTLKDFRNGEGKPGYFQQSLHVYGRAGEPCRHCRTPIAQIRLAGRASAYCPRCQGG